MTIDTACSAALVASHEAAAALCRQECEEALRLWRELGAHSSDVVSICHGRDDITTGTMPHL